MAVNCRICGQSMAAAEVTQRRDGVTGNWHTDCAYLDYLIDNAEPQGQDLWLHTLLCARRKLTDKHIGNTTEFP